MSNEIASPTPGDQASLDPVWTRRLEMALLYLDLAAKPRPSGGAVIDLDASEWNDLRAIAKDIPASPPVPADQASAALASPEPAAGAENRWRSSPDFAELHAQIVAEISESGWIDPDAGADAILTLISDTIATLEADRDAWKADAAETHVKLKAVEVEDHYPSHEALHEVVCLLDEYDALTGGGPGWRDRWEKARARATQFVGRDEP